MVVAVRARWLLTAAAPTSAHQASVAPGIRQAGRFEPDTGAAYDRINRLVIYLNLAGQLAS
jgi:hypothetical protein